MRDYGAVPGSLYLNVGLHKMQELGLGQIFVSTERAQQHMLCIHRWKKSS